jgi:anti-sigma-K factor RskA
MNDEANFDTTAGEYVLGTLDAAERAAVERERLTDPELDRAILDWERRLSPLGELAPDIAPPSGLYAAIEARLTTSTASFVAQTPSTTREPTAEIISLKARVRRWQVGAVVSGLLAASLAGVIVFRPDILPRPENRFVAVLQKDAVSPAFVVSVDLTTKQLSVRQVSADKLSGKSYELWLVNAAFPQPKSLGLVHDAGVTRGVQLAAYSPDVVEHSVLAVSLEPEGGSPTGLPTGPVVFSGKLIEAAP